MSILGGKKVVLPTVFRFPILSPHGISHRVQTFSILGMDGKHGKKQKQKKMKATGQYRC